MVQRNLVLALILVGSLTLAGRADIILGNHTSTTNMDLVGFGATAGYSVGFTVGSQAVELSSVQIDMKANTLPGGLATLQLRPDVGGNPAASTSGGVVNFNDQLILSATQFDNYLFTSAQSIQLTANTKYWLTIGTNIDSGAQPLNGLILRQRDLTTGPLAIFEGVRSGFYDDQRTVIPNDFTPDFQINGIVAVPEPSSLSFAAIASCILAWRNRPRALRNRSVRVRMRK